MRKELDHLMGHLVWLSTSRHTWMRWWRGGSGLLLHWNDSWMTAEIERGALLNLRSHIWLAKAECGKLWLDEKEKEQERLRKMDSSCGVENMYLDSLPDWTALHPNTVCCPFQNKTTKANTFFYTFLAAQWQKVNLLMIMLNCLAWLIINTVPWSGCVPPLWTLWR